MIKLKNISKEFNGEQVLKNINLEIKKGEFFVLAGTSGSGKTTLLKMINYLLSPTKGSIEIDKKDIKDYPLRELRLDIGYVLQQIALFPNMSVRENIELIPEMKKWDKKRRAKKARYLLNKIGLDSDKYLDRFPSELSGGEQQRVGILRAIITEPKILLMDEPFSALDPISRAQLQNLIKELHKELKITVVFVTHDMKEAMYLGDRICILSKGEVIQVDSPENIKNNPKNQFVKNFFQIGEEA
ncbi:MAG: ABC transporter ATP-binding protein [Fusobacterium sp.]|uniref:ABC transporter ATP-binding protein n=1 Tax=Fusobacterium sp. TaxID=68766 RepID=UPI0026DB6CB6|nr:ABC transporter ATP-binding protein [Fusobacterium sp.]MDO4689986.1 ABC transporter ATP-binding protein [Fusobacterium sp.]